MEWSSYSDSPDPDYVFGQRMLTLRSALGLTQARLAEYLGVSRRAVVKWESGTRYPTAEHLKKYMELAVQQGAFPSGREDEEIRTLWQASRQRVLLDEAWLGALLSTEYRVPGGEFTGGHSALGASGVIRPRHDWGDALSAPSFYGRTWELDILTEWVVKERCRVVSVLGLGGIGKSALAVSLMRQVADQFDVVIWRSLRDAPTIEALLDDCLQVIDPQVLAAHDSSDNKEPLSTEGRLNALLDLMRHTRILLVLDNLETLLEEGARLESTGEYHQGVMRSGYETFGRFLRMVAETEHRSCLLCTSREKPADLVPLEGSRSPVRALRLTPLEAEACDSLLAEKEVKGTAPERASLIEIYAGNPLALKIVAQTIVDLFGGEPGPFLEQGGVIYGGVRALLAEQFNRLSPLEQGVMVWLAVLREPATLEELRALVATPVSPSQLLEGVEALRRRSLIERAQQAGRFTLQSVVLEYVTARLIGEAGDEIASGQLERLIEHGIVLAQSPEYVRQTQERLIVAPILEKLLSTYGEQALVEERLLATLSHLSSLGKDVQGYGPANIVALLHSQRGDLRGLDLSGLVLRGVYLQSAQMQDTSLAGASFRDSLFTQTFDAILSVAVSSDGAYLAACGIQGDIRFWSASDYTLERVWKDPEAELFNFALSADGQKMATASSSGVLKLWDIPTGVILWSSDVHSDVVNRVLFTPDGHAVVTCADDATIQLLDAATGRQLQVLQHPTEPYRVAVPAIACSPDGRLLASSDVEGRICVWALNGHGSATLVRTITDHTKVVAGLAFSPDSGTLASAGWDGTIKLWDVSGDVPAGRLRRTLLGDRGPMSRVAWSPDGSTIACGGQDNTIWIWDVAEESYRAVLRGHTGPVRGLAFTPDSHNLLSGSGDGTLRVWELQGGKCMRVMQGYTLFVHRIDWSPDTKQIVSDGSDLTLTIYDLAGAAPPRVLKGHNRLIYGLAWSSDGRRIASSELDNIRIWDASSGACLEVLINSDDPSTVFEGIDWGQAPEAPTGGWLASATQKNGIMIWDMSTALEKETSRRHSFRRIDSSSTDVMWSPDGTCMASADADENVSLWRTTDGALLKRLGPHPKRVFTLAWSPSGRMLATCADAAEEGAFFVWDVDKGNVMRIFPGPLGLGVTVAWGEDDSVLVSGSLDGKLRWWDLRSGECKLTCDAHEGLVQHIVRSPDGRRLASCGMDGAIMIWDLRSGEHLQTLRRDRPYERLNITGVQGLTEAQKATLRALGAVEDDTLNGNNHSPKG